jgi:hypothetical protein
LFAGSGRLDHLIVGTILLAQKALTEPKRKIINNLSLSIRKEFPVIAVRWYKARILLHRVLFARWCWGMGQNCPDRYI